MINQKVLFKTTKDAQIENLPNSDVYRSSHLMYKDDLHRKYAYIELCKESIKAFSDSVTISNRRAFESGFSNANKCPDLYYRDVVVNKIIEYRNYEHFKIATGFEIFLKAKLLLSGYVMHEIKNEGKWKELSNKQRLSPVLIEELMRIDEFHFDNVCNFLPSIKFSSIKFSIIVNQDKYKEAIMLEDRIFSLINEYRELRNQIHLPGDVIETPIINSYSAPIGSVIAGFVNSQIVDSVNSLIQRNDLIFDEVKCI